MNEYFMGLLALCVCICVVELLTPAGEGEGIARHLKLLCAICLLVTMISPLIRLLQGGESLPRRLDAWLSEWLEGNEEKKEEYGALWEERWEDMDVSYAEAAIASLLSQRFSVSDQEIRVKVTVNEDGTAIREVRVALSGKAIWINTHEMEDYIRNTLGSESSIFIE
ncbi:MAG: hypothetical protein E7625_04580 [Ruminococcaceae bacterium]|nr:hypothetical protein [Oscillospiraceae bacterium]